MSTQTRLFYSPLHGLYYKQAREQTCLFGLRHLYTHSSLLNISPFSDKKSVIHLFKSTLISPLPISFKHAHIPLTPNPERERTINTHPPPHLQRIMISKFVHEDQILW